jgi:hypothetical protein
MTHIWERLFIGGLNDAKRLAKGNPNHIETVISLCEACVAPKRKGVNYIHMPIEDEQPVPVAVADALHRIPAQPSNCAHAAIALRSSGQA